MFNTISLMFNKNLLMFNTNFAIFINVFKKWILLMLNCEKFYNFALLKIF